MTQKNYTVEQGLQINSTVGNTTMTNTGITQMPDENFTILVQDADDDGYSVELNVDDGAGNVLSSYQQQRDQIELGFPSTSTYYQFNDNGRLVLPTNTEMWTDAGSNLNIIARSVTDSSFVEIMTQDNTDTKRSNITLTRDTANITTGSGTNTWTFDTNGTLTAPGNILASNFIGSGSNVDIVAGSYDWTFVNDGNLVLPGNTFAVKYANGTAVSLGGAGSYGNANVADFLDSLGSNAIVTTGNITGGNLIATANVLGNGYARLTGTFDESQASTAGLYLGYAGGTPRIMFGTGNTNQTLEIDNDAGTLRFYKPGTTLASLTNSGVFSAAGNITGANISTTGNITAGNIIAPASTANTQILFNNAGVVGGSAAFTFDTNGNTLNLANSSSTLKVADIQTPTAGVSLRLIPASGITYSYGNFLPLFANTYDLGGSGSRWNNVFANVANVVTLNTTGNIVTGAQIQSTAFTGANISWVANGTTSFEGNIRLGGTGRILSPGGAASIETNNNGANIPQLRVTTTAAAANTTSGGLIVSGGAGIAGNVYIGGTATTGVSALVAGATNTLLSNTVAGFTGNVNNYTQVTFQNLNTGADATADFILTADNGNDTVNYSDFGIINSGYDNSTPTNSLGNIVFAADTYIYAQGNISNISQSGGNLVIGTTTAGKNVKIFAGGNTASALIANISNTGISVTGNVTASNFVGNISITGNVTGTSPNVTLVAGSFSTVFDNTGLATFPGNVSVVGNVITPNLPAFRVYGTSSSNIPAGTTITSTQGATIDYNQGSYYNNTTGIFTAPVAGIYSATATLRVGSTSGLNQASIQKNGNGAGANVVAFWEVTGNSTSPGFGHMSMAGMAKLAVGDTLRLQVIAGNVNFDSNDSWAVTFIG